MQLDTNNHSVFLLHYHLIMCVKYRNKVINDAISNRLKEIFLKIAPSYHITLEDGTMIWIISIFFSEGTRTQKSVSSSMLINLQAAGSLKKNFLRSGNPFGKKCSGHRATAC